MHVSIQRRVLICIRGVSRVGGSQIGSRSRRSPLGRPSSPRANQSVSQSIPIAGQEKHEICANFYCTFSRSVLSSPLLTWLVRIVWSQT